MDNKRLKKRVELAIKTLKNDECYKQKTATVDVNAPLALVQCSIESQLKALRWVLAEMKRP